jgi:hypothetical protein
MFPVLRKKIGCGSEVGWSRERCFEVGQHICLSRVCQRWSAKRGKTRPQSKNMRNDVVGGCGSCRLVWFFFNFWLAKRHTSHKPRWQPVTAHRPLPLPSEAAGTSPARRARSPSPNPRAGRSSDRTSSKARGAYLPPRPPRGAREIGATWRGSSSASSMPRAAASRMSQASRDRGTQFLSARRLPKLPALRRGETGSWAWALGSTIMGAG